MVLLSLQKVTVSSVDTSTTNSLTLKKKIKKISVLRSLMFLLTKVSGHLGIENTLLVFIIVVDQDVSMAGL